jgi:hypothetical protein
VPLGGRCQVASMERSMMAFPLPARLLGS